MGDYTISLQKKVANLRVKLKKLAKKQSTVISYYAEDLLPNLRRVEKCCETCRFCEGGYEGERYCKVLQGLVEEFRDTELYVSTSVSPESLCDFWEAEAV
jgi:hypothetical protein